MLDKTQNLKMSFSPYLGLFDILIEKDNFWRLINESIDFSFIYDEVKSKYSDSMGRPAENPEVMLKYILLKNYYKLSDRDLILRTKTDMLFKYFLGYDPEELEFINYSSLSKFRKLRLVDSNILEAMIRLTVEKAVEAGIVGKHINIIVDSTHTNSMFKHRSPREELIERSKELRKAVYSVNEELKDKMPKKRENTRLLEDQIAYCNELVALVESDKVLEQISGVSERLNYLKECMEDTKEELEYARDQDAKIGHKSADSSFFGYKNHLAITPERLVVGAIITSGEKHDGKQLEALINQVEESGLKVDTVIGDGAYSEKNNLEMAKEKDIKLVSKLSKLVTHGSRKEEFEYNKDAGMYVCPEGHMAMLKRKTGSKLDKSGKDTRVESYFFDVEKCKYCKRKEGCYKEGAATKTYSVKIKQAVHVDQQEYMETDEFKELYKERYKIEAKNAELKNNYGYGKATSCGILGMNVQSAATIFLSNMKRIIKLSNEKEGTSQ